MKKKIKKTSIIILILGVVFTISSLAIDFYVDWAGSRYIVTTKDAPKADCIIVLGAKVYNDGRISDMLQDRMKVGLDLYKTGKATKILVSGDHGQTNYDEVNNMRLWLEARGVPSEHIFMDHAGFDTYDSMYRARDVFLVKKALVVSQKYHVVRAVYTGRSLGIEVYGVTSDLQNYFGSSYYRIRDVGARVKAFVMAGIFKPNPKYLGEAIPISGSGLLTHDK